MWAIALWAICTTNLAVHEARVGDYPVLDENFCLRLEGDHTYRSREECIARVQRSITARWLIAFSREIGRPVEVRIAFACEEAT